MHSALRAQDVSGIAVFKVDEYAQNSSAGATAGKSDMGVAVYFTSYPPVTLQMALKGPGGNSIALQFQEDASYYSGEAQYTDRAALNAAFPDGAYSLVITGGPTVSFTVASGSPVAPTLITNFASLQSAPGPSPTVTWNPIPGSSSNDELSFLISASDGTELFSPSDLSPTATSVVSTSLPEGETLTADLTYVRVASGLDATGSVEVLTGSGFNVEFPIIVAVQGPTIQTPPASQDVLAGTQVILSVASMGASQTYQWSKDGDAIAGATSSNYFISAAQTSDAGQYTVTVSNSAGSTTSAPATVSVAPGLLLSTYAGVHSSGPGYADGPAANAQFSSPTGVAVDASGNVYVADSGNFVVRMITPAGTVSTIAGAAGQPGSADGVGSAARFMAPWGVAVDGLGNIYVSDRTDETIREISPGGVVTTLAGTSGQIGHADGSGAGAQFNHPQALAIDSGGNLLVADSDNYLVRRVTPDGNVTTVAGNPGFFYQDPVGAGLLGTVQALAADGAGNIYVPGFNNLILMITPSGAVNTVTGQAGATGIDENQVGPNANIMFPSALAVGPSGSLYVGKSTEILLVNPGGFVTELAGSVDGLGYNDGTGIKAEVNGVSSMAVDSAGNLYLADTGNNVIRKGVFQPGSAAPGISIATQPQSEVVAQGDSVVLNGVAAGNTGFYAWYKDGVAIPGATGPSLLIDNTTAADAGSYTLLAGNVVGTVTSSPAVVSFVATTDPGRLINLSVRSYTGSGAQTFISGFVLSGSAGSAEPLLIRGIGPGLVQFGVTNALSGAELTVLSGTQAIAMNDAWGGGAALATAFASVGAFALAPASDDAAIEYNFPPGPYTAQISGGGAATGVALAEVYDLSTSFNANSPRLINVSARTQVGTGANILVAGFVIGGSTSKTVLIRAAGPALTQFGVSGILQDPNLQIFSGSTLIAGNAGWSDAGSTLRNTFYRVGAFVFPDGSQDSAVVVTLAPGPYTAQVSGVSGDTGVALVEVYEVP